jgi:hypothetical protein
VFLLLKYFPVFNLLIIVYVYEISAGWQEYAENWRLAARLSIISKGYATSRQVTASIPGEIIGFFS